MEEISRRSISGKGLLKLPEANKNWRRFHLVGNVLRLPISQRIDKEFNPQKTYYATLVFLRDDNVIRSEKMEFDHQAWDFYPPYDGQLQIALKCAYQGILESFVNLGLSLGVPPISLDNGIKDYTELVDIWDEVRIVCYSSSAIELILYAEDFKTCNDDFKKPSPPPGKPPVPPPPPLPPLIPPPADHPEIGYKPPAIGDLSLPYDPATNDNGNTAPYAGDEAVPPDPPTQGLPCGRYLVKYEYDVSFNDNPAGTLEQQATVFGKIGAFSIVIGATSRVFLECQGVIASGSGTLTNTCLSYSTYLVADNGQSAPQIKITAVRFLSVESA
jgi:hypothetical protein